MGERLNITDSVFIGFAGGLIWTVCVVTSMLKGKIWSALIGIIGAAAMTLEWTIGIWSLLNPFVWVPVIAAMRLGRPDSLWAYWFYSSRAQKYARAVLKYDIVRHNLGLQRQATDGPQESSNLPNKDRSQLRAAEARELLLSDRR
jgi:hypothetical protein